MEIVPIIAGVILFAALIALGVVVMLKLNAAERAKAADAQARDEYNPAHPAPVQPPLTQRQPGQAIGTGRG